MLNISRIPENGAKHADIAASYAPLPESPGKAKKTGTKLSSLPAYSARVARNDMEEQ